MHSLLLGQIDSHFPILYSYGDDYLIREYIHGLTLDQYLLKEPFTDNIGKQIINLYCAMKYVGYKRLDCALFHIFLANDYNFKLIDTCKAMKKTYEYPQIMIEDLNKLGYKNDLLNYVKSNNPLIYSNWEKSINKK